jgi:hypothetical protein
MADCADTHAQVEADRQSTKLQKEHEERVQYLLGQVRYMNTKRIESWISSTVLSTVINQIRPPDHEMVLSLIT